MALTDETINIPLSDALLKTALLKEGINRLAKEYERDEINADQLRNRVMTLDEEINNTPTGRTIVLTPRG